MAERRMLSKKIFQSRKFLMMPFEAQALYTHLILSSDDDGVVEAFPIVRMIGAKEDSLGLLLTLKNKTKSEQTEYNPHDTANCY